jgi:hypothetical protein
MQPDMQAENLADAARRRLDGRTTEAKRIAVLIAQFEAESRQLGGGSELSPIQRLAIRNCALLIAVAEAAQEARLAGDMSISVNDVVRASGAARRAWRDLNIGFT